MERIRRETQMEMKREMQLELEREMLQSRNHVSTTHALCLYRKQWHLSLLFHRLRERSRCLVTDRMCVRSAQMMV